MQAAERAAPGNCRCSTGGRAVWCLTGRANASSQIILVCRVENAAIRLNCGCVDLFIQLMFLFPKVLMQDVM